MPSFTFEKISPPVNHGSIQPISDVSTSTLAKQKRRGVIVQMLDRFVEARVKKTMREERGVIARNKRKRK